MFEKLAEYSGTVLNMERDPMGGKGVTRRLMMVIAGPTGERARLSGAGRLLRCRRAMGGEGSLDWTINEWTGVADNM